MSIDQTVAELTAALQSLGLAGPRPPVSTDDLDELVDEIAPLRLPDDLRGFWELIDTSTLTVERSPALYGPGRALIDWRIHQSPGFPAVLLPIAYQSWSFTWVELHGPHDAVGGATFDWSYGDSAFLLTALSVGELIETTVHALRAGQFRRGGGLVHLVPDGAEYATLGDGKPSGPHPMYGPIASVPVEPAHWPDRWLHGPAQ